MRQKQLTNHVTLRSADGLAGFYLENVPGLEKPRFKLMARERMVEIFNDIIPHIKSDAIRGKVHVALDEL